MGPEVGGKYPNRHCRNLIDDGYHNCIENERALKRTPVPEMNFSSVQMVFRKRRRGGGKAGESCSEECHHSFDPQQCNKRTRQNYQSISPSSSLSFPPLVLIITSLVVVLCLAPLSLVHSLPFDSRSSAVGVAGGGNHRSQMDLLIDPIHQAEFGGEEPLESKRVVAKSVFDMVLRTPPPPTSSSSRCPPGTQSPFEGGPCIKKSTDPVALVDQSFLLDTLRGLAKEGMLLSTGPTKTRKRRPGRPGGGGRTTPNPQTTPPTPSTIMTTTMESTPSASGDSSTPILEELLTPSNFDIQTPVFEEATTLTEKTVPSTIPSTATPIEEAETRTPSDSSSDRRIASSNRTTPSATHRPLLPDNGEHITTEAVPPLDLLTSQSEATTIAFPSTSPIEQMESGQEDQLHKQQLAESHIAEDPLDIDITTMEPAPPIDDRVLNDEVFSSTEAESHIASETTGFSQESDSLALSTRLISTQPEILTTTPATKTTDLPTMTATNKDSIIPFTAPKTTSGPGPVDNDNSSIRTDGADEDVTSVTTSFDLGSLELEPMTNEGTKYDNSIFAPAITFDMLLTTGMIDAGDSRKDNILISNDTSMEMTRTPLLLKGLTSPEVEENGTISEATPIAIKDDNSAYDEDRKAGMSPQVPIIIIKSKSVEEVESKKDEWVPQAEEEQVEPLGQGIEADLIKDRVQTRNEEHLQNDVQKEMMLEEGDMTSVTGTTESEVEEHKGVIGEEQLEPEPNDGQPSSVSPVVNHWTESPYQMGNEEENRTVMMTMVTATPPEKEIPERSGTDDDLLIINNPEISPSHNQYRLKDLVELRKTTPWSHEDDGNNDGKSLNSNEDFTSVWRDEKNPERIPETSPTHNPPEVAVHTSTRSPFRPVPQKDSDSTLLRFQLPIVTTGPNDAENSREEEDAVGVSGFQKFPEFPLPSARIRFPSTSGNAKVPVERGRVIINRGRGTQKPIFVQDFQLDFPPLQSEKHQQQQWQSPKPFLIPPQTPSDVGTDQTQTTESIQPDSYESGSTEYLESELDRHHQKTRSRNRIRMQEHQLRPSTNHTLPVEFSFFPRNSYPYHSYHLPPQSSSSHVQRETHPKLSSPLPPLSSQQPFLLARRNPSPSEFSPFGHINFRPAGHDRFHNNNRRLIW